MTDNTELLPVTQEDIAMALEHLGYDSVDDLHYWAENDTELRRFDELCSRFARHRLNTRPTQGHDALVEAWGKRAGTVEVTSGSELPHLKIVFDDKDTMRAFNDILTNLPTPQAEASPLDDGLVAELEEIDCDEADEYDWDEHPSGFSKTQSKTFRWGKFLLIIHELNFPNRWDDKAFNAACATLKAALRSRPSGDGEGE